MPVYDLVTKQILARNVTGQTQIQVPADGARLAVLVPAAAAARQDGRKLFVGDILVDPAWRD